MIYYLSILCGFFILASFQLSGQGDKTNKILHGYVIDSKTDLSVAYVQVFNESTRNLVISDTAGYFEMAVKGADTLILTCLGYQGKVYVTDTAQLNNFQTIKLIPQIYTIEEVDISKYRNYKQFQRDFLQVETNKEPHVDGLPKPKYREVPLLLDTNYLRSSEFLFFHPISYFYYNLSKEERSKRKAYYAAKRQREQVVIDKKFNRDIVEKITGLKDEELTKFIGFCNFSHEFLFHATELEIVQKIDEKYQEYKLIQDAGTEDPLTE